MKKNTVLVLGGDEVASYAARLLLLKNYRVVMYIEEPDYDENKLRSIIKNLDLDFQLIKGDKFSEQSIFDVELAVKSPNFEDYNRITKIIKNKSIPIIGEMELAYLLSKGTVAAIAGSNGKTTTSLLLNNILKKYYIDTYIAGERICPLSKEVLSSTEKSAIVIDCSDRELKDIKSFKPNVAAILNINKDSARNYITFESYINTVINVASNMTKSDYLILNFEDEILKTLARKKDLFKCKIVFFSSKRALPEGIYLKDGYIYLRDKNKNIKLLSIFEIRLKGIHNYENIMAGILLAYYMAVPISDIVDAVKEFDPIPNCIEFIKNKSGVNFYNDSSATSPSATIRAMLSMDKKVILISGGKDTKYDYSDYSIVVKDKVRHLVLVGENKKLIAAKVRFYNFNNIAFADTIDEAVRLANNYANLGDTVIYSPASLPEDDTSIEKRGEKYKELVNLIK